MMLPDYWLTRPSVNFDKRTQIAFDELLDTTLRLGGCPTIPFTLPWPKWQFLCHLADQHDIALHGSGDPSIALFEPRQAHDLNEFGNQKAIYAASDGLWAMFFAIVDRDRFAMSITNACIRLADQTGRLHGPYYVFSVSQSALPSQPWRTGTVYLLPRRTFTTQPPIAFGASEVHVAQLASFVPVQPLAKLTVTPADFPFLRQIRGHDDQRLQDYATALLCFGFDPTQNALNDLAQDLLRRQQENTREVYEHLQRQGYAFSPDALSALLAKPSAQQPYAFVALLKEHGYGLGEPSAGKIVMAAGCAFATNDPAAVVEAAHRSGAVCLLAHPGRADGFMTYDVHWLDQLRQEVPIDGLEVYYPVHAPAQIAMYRAYAQRHHLLTSAGSDSHGPDKPPIKYRAELSRGLLERAGIQVA